MRLAITGRRRHRQQRPIPAPRKRGGTAEQQAMVSKMGHGRNSPAVVANVEALVAARAKATKAMAPNKEAAKAAKVARAAAKAAEEAAEAAALNSFSEAPSEAVLCGLKHASLLALLEKRRPPMWSDMLWQDYITGKQGALQNKVRQMYPELVPCG